MGLISDYTLAGSGMLLGLDLTCRDVFAGGAITVGMSVPFYEWRITQKIEYYGLTEQCAKDLAVSRIFTWSAVTSQNFPHKINKSSSSSVVQSSKQPRVYMVTVTLETSLDIQYSSMGPVPTVNVETGKKTYPFNVTISTGAGMSGGIYYILALFSNSYTSGTPTLNGSKTITITQPCILIVGLWNTSLQPTNPLVAIYS